MNNLGRLTDEAASAMSETEKKYNAAVMGSRALIRSTKKVIHAIHAGESYAEAVRMMDMLKGDLVRDSANEPRIASGPLIEDALGEYAEAKLLIAFVTRSAIPSCHDLKISPSAWSVGLCDCLGEMRRVVLAHLMSSDMDKAKEMFANMESVSDAIMTFDVPDSIAPIRRKQDIARGIMDRTRSDITIAAMSRFGC